MKWKYYGIVDKLKVYELPKALPNGIIDKRTNGKQTAYYSAGGFHSAYNRGKRISEKEFDRLTR